MSSGRNILCIIFVLYVSSTVAITSIKYMTSFCHGQSIFVNSSLVLELTNDLLEVEPAKNVYCTAKLFTDQGSRLLLHFVTLDISFYNLSPDRLKIYDYDLKGNATEVSPAGGLYGIYDPYYKHTSTGVKDYLSSSNMFRLDYMGKPTLLYRGFRILITSVKDLNADGECNIHFIRCTRSAICIPTSTMCNGDSNCGSKDDSDETRCNWMLSTGLEEKYTIGNIVMSGSLSCLSFIIVVVLVFVMVFRYNKRRYLRRESIPVHAKRSADGKWKISNDMGLTAHVFAPPTYDDAVADEENEEPPPAYESLPCSVRNSCELGQSQNGELTIVCIESRDIHLYNEGSEVPNVQCFMVNNNGEIINEDCGSDTTERSSSACASKSDTSSEQGSATEMESKNNDDDSSESISETGKLLPKKIDSNENFIRPKIVGIQDDGIEYIDDED